MKLYEIDQEIQKILDTMVVDEETGEVVLDTGALEALQEQRSSKLENAACYVKDLEAMVKAMREEEKSIAQRRQVLEKKANRIREWIAFNLGGEKLETARVKLSTRKGSVSCVIDDIRDIEAWYFSMVKTPWNELDEDGRVERDRIWKLDLRYEPSLNKAELKKLMADYDIPGAHLETGKPSLQIK